MTFEELDQQFPNGFNDAEITSLSPNQPTRKSESGGKYQHALLSLNEFYYFVIEPPMLTTFGTHCEHLKWTAHLKM